MRILILTNEKHIGFVLGNCISRTEDEIELLVKCYGEFDWSEDYDIGISFMYQHKVPKEQLVIKPWFNFHPAPLPEYKGRNLCYHAIMNGETEFGASLHYMDEDFDTGDIIAVRNFPIHDWTTAGDVSEFAMLTSEALFVEYLPRILAEEEFTRYKNIGGTYYKKEPIDDLLYLSERDERKIRAITYGEFCPKVNIDGVTYKIVRDE